MASRSLRFLTRSTSSFLKSSGNKPTTTSLPSTLSPRSFSRSVPQLGALQSLLPLHTAVSSARLTSCLGIDSGKSRSLSQGMLCSANPGV